MNWGSGGFSFGPLSGIQSGLYENQPDLGFQKLIDYFTGGQAGWGDNTTFGRWLKAQQQPFYNRYSQEAAANPTGGLTWTNYLEQHAPEVGALFNSMPGYLRGSNPAMFRVRRYLG
jgi:hypothetical protein